VFPRWTSRCVYGKIDTLLLETLKLKVSHLFVACLLTLCTAAPGAFAEEVKLDSTSQPDPSDTSLHWTLRLLSDAIGKFPDEIRMVASNGEQYFVAETREGSSRPTYEIETCSHAIDWYKAFTEELIAHYHGNSGKPAGGSYTRFVVERGKLKSIEFLDTKNEKTPDGCGSSTNAPSAKRHLEPDALKRSIESAIKAALAEPSIPFPKDVEQIVIHLGIGDGSTNWWHDHNAIKTGLRPLKKTTASQVDTEPLWKRIERFHREESEIQKKERESSKAPPSNWAEASKEYNERGIKRAQAALERSKIFYDTACNLYLSSLIHLAYQYHEAKRTEEADKTFLEALAYYKLKSAKIPLADHSFWSFLSKKLSPGKFDKCFFEALNIAEDATKDQLSDKRAAYDLNRHIFDSMRNLSDESRKVDEGAILKRVVQLRESKRGTDHKSLPELLRHYARVTEKAGATHDAEQLLLRASSISNQDEHSQAYSRIYLAEFYVRQKMWAKAKESWLQAETFAKKFMPGNFERSLGRLIEDYKRSGNIAETLVYVDSLLAMGNGEVLVEIDPILDKLIVQLESSGNSNDVLSLVGKRVAASAKVETDGGADDWKMRLSDLYLKAGRTADSERVFDELVKQKQPQDPGMRFLYERRMSRLRAAGLTDAAAKLAKFVTVGAQKTFQPRFAMFAIKDIRFGHNTSFEETDSEDPKNKNWFARGKKDFTICSLDAVYGIDNAIFEGTIFGKVDGDRGHVDVFGGKVKPLPADVNSYLDIRLEAPPNAVRLSKEAYEQYEDFAPGDYIVDASRVNLSRFGKKGPTRVFLTDDPSKDNAIELGNHDLKKAADLQVFYNGSKRLLLRDVNAVVVAPNATVEFPHNASFCGAVVANRILGESNNTYSFDVQMLNSAVTK
jgi:tetratricopeptide (TPR) repeat protein